MMAAAHRAAGHSETIADAGSTAPRLDSPLAKMQRAAIANAGAASPLAGGSSMFGGLMMAKIRVKAKRLRKGLPKRDSMWKTKEFDIEVEELEDAEEAYSRANDWLAANKPDEGWEFTGEWQTRGSTTFCKFRKKEMLQRILKLNEVVQLAAKSDDEGWKHKKMKKRYERILNEFRKAVVNFTDDVQFLVRCYDLLDEDEMEELTAEQMIRWVTLLADPTGVGDGDLLWVKTMGQPLGDAEIKTDLIKRLGKQAEGPHCRFDWQDFVIVTLDFYVLTGAAGMRRTFGELLEEGGNPDGSAAPAPLQPQPPQKKKASLADDVRERRAARAAKLGKQLGVAEKPPRSVSGAGAAAAAAPEATVGSGGGRPKLEQPEMLADDDDQEVVFSGSEDTVDLTNELLDEETRVAEAVPEEEQPQP
jgi:hypothetical protein